MAIAKGLSEGAIQVTRVIFDARFPLVLNRREVPSDSVLPNTLTTMLPAITVWWLLLDHAYMPPDILDLEGGGEGNNVFCYWVARDEALPTSITQQEIDLM